MEKRTQIRVDAQALTTMHNAATILAVIHARDCFNIQDRGEGLIEAGLSTAKGNRTRKGFSQ